MPGLAFGRLFDMGYLRLPVSIASALLILFTFLTAECKEFWQFLLCQGFGVGVRLRLSGSACKDHAHACHCTRFAAASCSPLRSARCLTGSSRSLGWR